MTTATRITTITDPVGIHARPASQFSQTAASSGCAVTVGKEPDGPSVDASSILSVMGLGVVQGDTIRITVDGENAEAVADGLIATLAGGK